MLRKLWFSRRVPTRPGDHNLNVCFSLLVRTGIWGKEPRGLTCRSNLENYATKVHRQRALTFAALMGEIIELEKRATQGIIDSKYWKRRFPLPIRIAGLLHR